MNPRQFARLCDIIWERHIARLGEFFKEQHHLKLYYDLYMNERVKGCGALSVTINLIHAIVGDIGTDRGWHNIESLKDFLAENYETHAKELTSSAENTAYVITLFSMTGPMELFNNIFVYPSSILRSALLKITKDGDTYTIHLPEKSYHNRYVYHELAPEKVQVPTQE